MEVVHFDPAWCQDTDASLTVGSFASYQVRSDVHNLQPRPNRQKGQAG